jgi:hypothetical protein
MSFIKRFALASRFLEDLDTVFGSTPPLETQIHFLIRIGVAEDREELLVVMREMLATSATADLQRDLTR